MPPSLLPIGSRHGHPGHKDFKTARRCVHQSLSTFRLFFRHIKNVICCIACFVLGSVCVLPGAAFYLFHLLLVYSAVFLKIARFGPLDAGIALCLALAGLPLFLLARLVLARVAWRIVSGICMAGIFLAMSAGQAWI